MANIAVRTPGSPEAIEILSSDEVLIGRGADCQIVLADGTVSRKHCLLKKTEQGYRVYDLSSRNTTLLNDAPFTEDVLLRSGDIIRAGKTDLLYVADVREFARPPSEGIKKTDESDEKMTSQKGNSIFNRDAATEPEEVEQEPQMTKAQRLRAAKKERIKREEFNARKRKNDFRAKVIIFCLFGIPFILFDIYLIWVYFLRDR